MFEMTTLIRIVVTIMLALMPVEQFLNGETRKSQPTYIDKLYSQKESHRDCILKGYATNDTLMILSNLKSPLIALLFCQGRQVLILVPLLKKCARDC